jgi:hypothetical protein
MKVLGLQNHTYIQQDTIASPGAVIIHALDYGRHAMLQKDNMRMEQHAEAAPHPSRTT